MGRTQEAPVKPRRGRTVAPPPIDDPDRRPAPSRSRRTKTDAASCGAAVGAAMGAFSLMVCGKFQDGLVATSEEEARIGAHLAACLETLPAPVGEAVAKGGPWLALSADVGGLFLSRMSVIQVAAINAKAKREGRVADGSEAPRGAAGPIADTVTGPIAPNPADVSPRQPESPWASGAAPSATGIIAPEPLMT